MANAPLRDRTAGVLALICPTATAKYFCKRGWTGFTDLPVGQTTLIRFNKSVLGAKAGRGGTAGEGRLLREPVGAALFDRALERRPCVHACQPSSQVWI